MMDVIRIILEKYGKALPVMDNASYHKSWALIGTDEGCAWKYKWNACSHTRRI